MKEELRHIRAMMNLGGLTRKEAARRMHLSHSALNRKLRGEISLTREERELLLSLAAPGREQRLDRP